MEVGHDAHPAVAKEPRLAHVGYAGLGQEAPRGEIIGDGLGAGAAVREHDGPRDEEAALSRAPFARYVADGPGRVRIEEDRAFERRGLRHHGAIGSGVDPVEALAVAGETSRHRREIARADPFRRRDPTREGDGVSEVGPGFHEGDAVGLMEGFIEADIVGVEGGREDQVAHRLPELGVLAHPVGLLDVGVEEASVFVIDIAIGVFVVEAGSLDGRLEAILEDVLPQLFLYKGIVGAAA